MLGKSLPIGSLPRSGQHFASAGSLLLVSTTVALTGHGSVTAGHHWRWCPGPQPSRAPGGAGGRAAGQWRRRRQDQALAPDEQQLIAALCLHAGHNFTKDEWARYIGSDTPWQPKLPRPPKVANTSRSIDRICITPDRARPRTATIVFAHATMTPFSLSGRR